jgi:hypothetical protein
MKDVIVDVFNSGKEIKYPYVEKIGTLKRKGFDIVEADRSFRGHVKEYPGFDVHHVETLRPEIYYIRGLVDDEKSGVTYVFSVKVDLATFGHDDFKDVMDDVISLLERGHV